MLKKRIVTFLLSLLFAIVLTTGALLAASFIVAIASTGIQTKFLISFENLKFKLSKLNPINGIKKMFSLKGLFELAKSLLKMILLIVVVYGEIKDRLPEMVRQENLKSHYIITQAKVKKAKKEKRLIKPILSMFL